MPRIQVISNLEAFEIAHLHRIQGLYRYPLPGLGLVCSCVSIRGLLSAALNCESGSSGLSRTALIAIYAMIGVVCLVLLVGVGLFCRRRIRLKRLGYKTFD